MEERNPFAFRPSMGGQQSPQRPAHAGSFSGSQPSAPQASVAAKPSIAGRVFDWVIQSSLVALFFGIPVFFTGFTLQGVAFEKQIYFYFFLLLGLVAWVSRGVITGEMRIRRTPLDIPILLFVAFYGIDVFFSVDRWHSFFGFFGDPSRGFLSVLALALAYFLLASHFTMARARWYFGAFVVSGMVVVLWSTLVLMKIPFLPGMWQQYAPLSLIGTVSTLATFLSILLPIFLTAVFLLSRDGKVSSARWGMIGAIGLFLLLDLFLLFGLNPFVSWPVLFGGLGFFLLFILATVVRPGEQWTWAPMLVFVLTLVFFMWGNNSVLRANLPVEVAPNTTLSWKIAKESLSENFFFGTGPASYGHAFSMYRPVEYNQNSLYSLRFFEGKGLFFESLASIGVIGTLFLLALWLSFLSMGIYLLASEKEKNKVFSLGLWTASVMLLIAGFFSAINGTLILISVLLSALALLVLLSESGSEEKYLSLSLKASPKFALTLAFIFMVVSAGVAFLFVFMGKVFMADLLMGNTARTTVASEDTARDIVRAIGLYPKEGRYFTRLSQEYMGLANIEGQKAEADRNIQNIATLTREAVLAAERGMFLMPADVVAAESTGQIYENASLFAGDALPKAYEAYERALNLEPQSPTLLFKLGQMKKALADQKPDGEEKIALLSEAKTQFKASIEKKKDLAVTHYFLALTLSGLKEYDTALSEMDEAIRLNKNNLTYQYNKGVLYQVRGVDGDDAKAEKIFKDVLEENERLIDVRLSLGLLYEKRGDKSGAANEYEKTLEYLPEEGSDAIRSQIQTMVQNARSGRGNIRNGVQPNMEVAPAENTVAPTPVPTAPELQPEAQGAPIAPPTPAPTPAPAQ